VVVWIGLALYGLAFAPAGLLALALQAIILGSIFVVTVTTRSELVVAPGVTTIDARYHR
jgi:hypothetical protein